MNTWKGKISKKVAKDWNGITLHSFQLEESQRWFRTGQEPIPFDEGALVVFEEIQNKVNVKSMRSGAEVQGDVQQSTAQSGSVSGATARSAGISRDEYWTRREQRDVEWETRRRFAAARADATRIVSAALAHDHLPHAQNVAKGKRLDLLVGYIKEVTHTLMEMENE